MPRSPLSARIAQGRGIEPADLVLRGGRVLDVITGDLVHFHENYNSNGVPWFNVSRADSLASIDRFKQIAMNHRAKVIIQHDARDIGILPAWPAGAK